MTTLRQAGAEVFVPDGATETAGLARTTSLGVVAHQDDLEILCYPGILEAFRSDTHWFSGVVMTNGSGSARTGAYAACTDEQMCRIRRAEQKKAAIVGEYAAVALLDYPSSAIKTPGVAEPVADLRALLEATRPDVIYTHNLTDKHDTHVGVVLRLVEALRALPAAQRPRRLYGCEVWRDLDWLRDEDKCVFAVDGHENLAASLLGLYDSQVAGGKRYDLAALGRRVAHATFFASHDVDDAKALIFGMDMTELISESGGTSRELARRYIERFADEVYDRLERLGG